MKRSTVLASLFALFLASAGLAVANPIAGSNTLPNPWAAVSGPDPMFDFTFTGPIDAGYGSLNTTDQGGGEFWATGGTLTITAGPDIGTYGLYIPGGPGLTASADGQYHFDNLIFPSSTQLLDGGGGLLFTNGTVEINLFSVGPGSYQLFDSTNGVYGPHCDFYQINCLGPANGPDSSLSTFTLTSVPEPTALVLLGFVLVGLGFSLHKKAQSQHQG